MTDGPTDTSGGLLDEVREVLRELVEQTGASSARIVENDDLRTGVPARTMAVIPARQRAVNSTAAHHENFPATVYDHAYSSGRSGG